MPYADEKKQHSGEIPDVIRQAFMPSGDAAIVPAVRLSQYQWQRICDIITTLADLHNAAPSGLKGMVIEGNVLADVAEKAAGISFLATYGEVSTSPDH